MIIKNEKQTNSYTVWSMTLINKIADLASLDGPIYQPCAANWPQTAPQTAALKSRPQLAEENTFETLYHTIWNVFWRQGCACYHLIKEEKGILTVVPLYLHAPENFHGPHRRQRQTGISIGFLCFTSFRDKIIHFCFQFHPFSLKERLFINNYL